jgi:aminoglycoside phosphotransferase (APT) family kinase protein
MAHPAAAATAGLADPERLVPWLAAHLPGFEGPATIRKFAGGQSNPTFLVEAASGRAVLRRKPPGVLLKSAHAIEREYRLMRALENSTLPVPKAYYLCEDERSRYSTMPFIKTAADRARRSRLPQSSVLRRPDAGD